MSEIQTNQTSSNSNNSKRKKKIFIIGACIFAGILIIFLNFNYLVITYYYLFKYEHFNNNDKVYISKDIYNKDAGSFGVMRLIRPITEKDIDTMDISNEKKLTLKANVNPSLKPYVKYFKTYFDSDEMKKQKSTFVGSFIKWSIVNVKYDNDINHYAHTIVYELKPNKNVLHETPIYKDEFPENYIFADSIIYVDPTFLSATDPIKN